MSMQSDKIRRTDRALDLVAETGHWMMVVGFLSLTGLLLVRMIVPVA